MGKQNLTRASAELFRRAPDERFESLDQLFSHCQYVREFSEDRWHPPAAVIPQVEDGQVVLALGDDGAFSLNSWSFAQLCRIAQVGKDTVNRLSPETACRAFHETLPTGTKPLQFLTEETRLRSLHGAQYTRLWNVELLSVLREFAVDFQPPQVGFNGATGLYAGEEDMFVFLIDPAGWAEIDGQAFAPGFFLWNSEVGRRSVGIQTFWFQKVCANHIVWDAVEIMEFTRKHTARVSESLSQIRGLLEKLVEKRDARRDSFSQVIQKAMREKLGKDSEEALKELGKQGIPRRLAAEAVSIAAEHGAFTIWALVDALTRLSARENAGDRTEADFKASQLLSLVA